MSDDEYNESEDNGNTKLSPSEIPCPFCGERDTACSHFLAMFDCTFDGEGKYGIGLIAGALYEIDTIGKLFEEIASCYARARYKGKRAKHPKAPKGTAFQEYVLELERVRVDPKAYDTEEEYCWEFRLNIECYAELVRGALLELLGFDVYEREAAIDAPLLSSKYALWYCSDANASAAKLKDELARALSDFKRDNGLV